MNKNQKVINFITLLTCGLLWAIVLCGFTYTYDTNTPLGSDDPAEADDRMREIKSALQERLNVEHVFDLTGTEVSGANTGKHTDITCDSIVNGGALTNTGAVAVTGAFSVNTNKFTVAAATGNTAIAGTLDVAGAGEIVGVATLGDASLLKTSAAPTTDAMIANKKYVDTSTNGDTPTPDDSLSATLVKNETYLAQTSGFVTAYVQSSGGSALVAWVHTSSPATGGVAVFNVDPSSSDEMAITFFVPSGQYFEITNNDTPVIHWTSLVTGGGNPIKQ